MHHWMIKGNVIPVRHKRCKGDRLARVGVLNRWRVEPDQVGTVDVGDGHSRKVRVIAEDLWRAVVVDETVVFPFDIGQFGVDVAAYLVVTSKVGGQETERVGDVLLTLPRRQSRISLFRRGAVVWT